GGGGGGAVEVLLHERVQGRIVALDPPPVEVQQLDGRDLPGVERGEHLGGGREGVGRIRHGGKGSRSLRRLPVQTVAARARRGRRGPPRDVTGKRARRPGPPAGPSGRGGGTLGGGALERTARPASGSAGPGT